ncbi:MAG TPA: acetylglutamate kinase [Minicystis sp.]|nr:acetylglutamate kinase [Minicystis sp.]
MRASSPPPDDKPRPPKTTQEVIVRLLRNLGSRKEVEQYLKQYASIDSQKFAVIKVGGNILAKELEALASSLTFLQNVGLYPIVIHGAGPQLDAALREAGVETTRVDGLRVTTARVLEIARKVFQRENLKLVEALEDLGTRARPVNAGVLQARLLDFDKLGYVGVVEQVHLDAIESSIRAGQLPIVSCLGETPSGQIVNVNADVAARELALAIQPFKVVFLTETGGLLDEEGQIVSAVNLAEDFDTLMDQPWLHGGMRLKIREIKSLLDGLPAASSVSITSPDRLAKELFTHVGSGTLVRRGDRVMRFDTLEGIDIPRLRGLLEGCFGRVLDADYFEKKPFLRVYLADSYRATAIVTHGQGVPYLDKFAVTTQAQGAGVGGSLWKRMRAETPKLYWRARNANEIAPWYFQQAQGSFKDATWTVFWCGLEGWSEIKACVEHAISLPVTLREHALAEV